MIRIYLFFLILLCCSTLYSAEPDRFSDWSKSGTLTNINNSKIVYARDWDLDGTNNKPCDSIFGLLIKSLSDSGTTIIFREGIFYFSKPIELPSNITIKGQGAGKTIFKCNFSGVSSIFNIRGNANSAMYNLKSSALKDSNFITLIDNKDFKTGDMISLGFNDSALIYSDWARFSVAQIFIIKNIVNDTIFLDNKIRKYIDLSFKPFVHKIIPKSNVSIENLTVIREDKTSEQTSNFCFVNAFNCSISCVESYYCNFAHVEVNQSKNIKISGSYFHKAHDYGGGGKGYGVMFENSASDCLAENNIFDSLRHSMIVQSGANGNVFAYNYSMNPFWSESMLPSNSAGDIVLHGNYPYCNLFESNVCQNIVLDNSHGLSGPLNTFFRNRAELYGIFMNNAPPADSMNNVIKNQAKELQTEKEKNQNLQSRVNELEAQLLTQKKEQEQNNIKTDLKFKDQEDKIEVLTAKLNQVLYNSEKKSLGENKISK